ncbi:uncharacterized protein LOC120904107 [Anopheles arabiensis]|uniref:F-box domain-containing protein n=2 Tax=gambiae species complex TaxID=44542 RepID=A0A453Z0N7_ANOGA|nr:uncharacterized protein LOC120904107 [Anopheles arabiensis]
MESSSSYCPFDGLPTEILKMIFDRLDFVSLKSISVTCRRFERLFTEWYACRFTLRIDDATRNAGCDVSYDYVNAIEKMHAVVEILAHSQRPYRKAHLDLQQTLVTSVQKYAVLCKLLEPRWLSPLTVLKLELGRESWMFAEDISDAVPKMDCLLELHLRFTELDPGTNECSTLKLTNASLQRLVLNHVIPYVVDCSNMRKLDIAHCTDVDSTIGVLGVAQKVGSSWWRLEPVEELCLVDDLNSFFRPNVSMEWFYQQMPYLRKLHFNGYTLRETMLRFICGSCVQLEELILSTVLVDTPNVLCHLSKLPRLRRFGICEIIGRREPLTFASVRLPKLEELLLGRLPLDWQSLASVQPISWLKIKLGSQQVAPICEVLCGQFVQLRLLWIDFYTFRHYRELLAELPKMNSLETLVLENVVYLCSLKALPPLPQLKRLIIYRCSKKVYERFHNNDALLANLVRDIQWIGVGMNTSDERGITDTIEHKLPEHKCY